MDMSAVKKRVLCVDDEPLNLKILQALLSKSGFDIVTAADGETALEMADKETIDLIFMDAIMPGIDGFEACKQLKESKQHNHIPVILLSALSPSECERKSREAGADAWLEKPVNKKDILEKLETYLNKEPR
jgi:two-component system cell cycle response regulator